MLDVRMLCLAALMGREASGYDIKKDLEKGSATGLIDASFGSIYPALARLTKEGFIEVRSEGAGGRDRKTYAMTPVGRAYFLRTLSGPLPDEKYRSPFLFAMLFATDLPRARVRAMIDQQVVLWEQKIAAIKDLMDENCDFAGERFVYGMAIASLQAGLDYLHRHRRTVEAAALAEPAGVGSKPLQTSFQSVTPQAAE